MTTISNNVTAADPHGLNDMGETLANAAELAERLGVDAGWLRRARRKRLVRYIDRRPNLPPGKDPSDRYWYAVIDIEKQCGADARAAPGAKPFASKHSKKPESPPPIRARRQAAPEVIFMARKAAR